MAGIKISFHLGTRYGLKPYQFIEIFTVTIFRSLLLTATMLASINAYAECTLQTAQTKMIETTNMMQVYNRQKIAYMEKDNTLPAAFEARFSSFDDRKNELLTQFGNETDANPDMGFEDEVDQKLCDGFDELFAEYAPEGYAAKQVNLQPTSSDPNCTSSSLWEKYGKLIQKQAALAKAGKFSSAEEADMMRIGTQVGEASTTDLAKACVHLDEFERIVDSK